MYYRTITHTLIKSTLSIAVFMLLFYGTTWGQTKLYKEYEYRTDLTAMCLLNHTILDTLKVDVTMLVPYNKEAAFELVKEFNLNIVKEKIDSLFGTENKSGLFTTNVWKSDVKKKFKSINSPDDYKDMSILVYNYNTGTILIFHNIDTKERYRAIALLLLRSLKTKKNLDKNNYNIKTEYEQ